MFKYTIADDDSLLSVQAWVMPATIGMDNTVRSRTKSSYVRCSWLDFALLYSTTVMEYMLNKCW